MRKDVLPFALAAWNIFMAIAKPEWIPSPYREIISIILAELVIFIILHAWLVPSPPTAEEKSKKSIILALWLFAFVFMAGSGIRFHYVWNHSPHVSKEDIAIFKSNVSHVCPKLNAFVANERGHIWTDVPPGTDPKKVWEVQEEQFNKIMQNYYAEFGGDVSSIGYTAWRLGMIPENTYIIMRNPVNTLGVEEVSQIISIMSSKISAGTSDGE